MNKKKMAIAAGIICLGMAASMVVAPATSQASTVVPVGSASCTITTSKPNQYIGSSLGHFSQIVNNNCTYAQAGLDFIATDGSIATTWGSRVVAAATSSASTIATVKAYRGYVWLGNASAVGFTF